MFIIHVGKTTKLGMQRVHFLCPECKSRQMYISSPDHFGATTGVPTRCLHCRFPFPAIEKLRVKKNLKLIWHRTPSCVKQEVPY